MEKYNIIDLFSGAGGLSLGLSWSGFNIQGAIDSDEDAVKTYMRNFAHSIFNRDIRELSAQQMEHLFKIDLNNVDVLVGGPPCQGFSIQRRGEDKDPRNQLVLEFVRFIKSIKPPMFLMENVPGLVNKRGKEVLNLLKKFAEESNYKLHIATLNASEFAVPQTRRRVFIVGEKLIDNKAFFEFPIGKAESKRTVRQAFEGLPSPPLDFTEHPKFPNHKRGRTSELNQLRISYVPQGKGREYIPYELQLECHKNLSVEKGGHRYVYGRLAWDDPAGTITARFDSFTRGKFAHPEENRTITLREGARLQTFPDDFVFEGTKVSVARQIGNAVPPLLGMILGDSLKEALNKRRRYEHGVSSR